MTNHPNHSKQQQAQHALGTWDELSEGERAAARAQAYPAILDDHGREWKLGKIADLQALNAELLAALKRMVEAYREGVQDDREPMAVRQALAAIANACKD